MLLSTMETTSKLNFCSYPFDYRKAIDVYDDLMKRNDYDRNIHAFKACCLYALCNYKEAKAEAKKAEDSELKNRLLF